MHSTVDTYTHQVISVHSPELAEASVEAKVSCSVLTLEPDMEKKKVWYLKNMRRGIQNEEVRHAEEEWNVRFRNIVKVLSLLPVLGVVWAQESEDS